MGLDVTGKYRYPSPRLDWLTRRSEPVIEPDLLIVDAHHHLWDEPGNPYGIDDLLADLNSGHRVVGTVFAQCHYAYRSDGPEHLRPVGETERIEILRCEAVRKRPDLRLCSGIVGFADLRSRELDVVLDAHLAASPNHFRGVRQSAVRDSHFPDGIVLRPAPARLLESPDFRRGARRLGERGLTFDAMVYHEQIPEVTELASAADGTTIVLDHYGCPIGVGYYQGRDVERFSQWRRDIRMLARCPNVRVKLGGLGMIVTGATYHLADEPPGSEQLAADWHPWVETCVEAFGAERCMFESNFPVDKAMYSYAVVWNAFKRITANYSSTDRNALFHGTATSTYRLGGME